MALLTQIPGVGFIHAEAEALADKLKYGDGIMWSGDPALELRIGVLTAPRRMQHPESHRWINAGDVVAKRYEVWRHTEDGEDVMLSHWRIDEFDRILFDLVQMRAGAEGKIPSVVDRIETANKRIEDKHRTAFRDAYGTMLEHMLTLWRDTSSHEAKTTFYQVGGSKDA